MTPLDIALHLIAIIMLGFAAGNFSQILVWLLIPETVVFEGIWNNGEHTYRRKWLFRIYPPHSRLLDFVEAARHPQQQAANSVGKTT